MKDNPYNRVEFNPELSQWVILIVHKGKAELGTRSAFATERDARRFANTIADCYKAVIAKTNP